MPKSNSPVDSRSTEEILREMEQLSADIDSAVSNISPTDSSSPRPAPPHRGGGALKSLLGFFVSVDPKEGEVSTAAGSVDASTEEGEPSSAATQGESSNKKRVRDLVADEPVPEFAEPESVGSDLAAKPFEEIYGEAGVADSACSVDELAKLLDNPAVINQPLSVKIIAVKVALSSKGVEIDVPIADAVRRDRALDAYQAMLAEHAGKVQSRNNELIEHLTKETEEYLKRKQVEMEALRSETAEISRQALDFALRREAEEKRMAELISPFLEGKPLPITVGNQKTQS
ncbi:MAG: hypothetical protein WKF84_10920 [Pyrinomonadaceae bacterium]